MKIQNGISLTPPSQEAQVSKRDEQLRDASKMYESYFLNEMVRAMRSTIPKDQGVLKQNFAEQIFTQQLDQQYVDGWSKQGGVGLADMIYNQISERFQSQMKGLSGPKGALPIQPKSTPHAIPNTDSIQMKMIPLPQGKESASLEYRFEVPHPSGAPFEVLSPMSGQVVETQTLGEGWNMVRLDHGQGLRSELTFPGQRLENVTGIEVQAGQKLGVLDSGRPVLAWKLDSSSV